MKSNRYTLKNYANYKNFMPFMHLDGYGFDRIPNGWRFLKGEKLAEFLDDNYQISREINTGVSEWYDIKEIKTDGKEPYNDVYARSFERKTDEYEIRGNIYSVKTTSGVKVLIGGEYKSNLTDGSEFTLCTELYEPYDWVEFDNADMVEAVINDYTEREYKGHLGVLADIIEKESV